MQKVAIKNKLPIMAKLILSLAFFITIASGSFQLQHALPSTMLILSLLSKVVFILSLVTHVTICLRKKQSLVNKYDCLLIIFFIWLIISSYINGHSWLSHFPFIIKALAIRYLLSLGLVYSKQQVINILASVFSIIIYINFLFLLFFPGFFGYNEGTEVYLISTNYNQFGAIFIPAIYINLLATFNENGRISRLYPLLIICFLSVIIEGSATTSVALALLMFVIIFIQNPRLIKIGSTAIFIMAVLFFITFVVPLFSFLDIPIVSQIVEGLGKDMTFSSRTRVWLYADFQISHSPIFGYGVCDKELYEFLLGNFVHPHNIILHILLHGGIIGLFIFTIFVAVGIKQIYFVKNLYLRNLLLFISVIFLLMSQLEVYNNMFIYIYILFMYISKDYQNQCFYTEYKHNVRIALQ